LAMVQTVLEIHVNLMSYFWGEVCIFDKEIKKIERILICFSSRKFSVFIQKKTFTHVLLLRQRQHIIVVDAVDYK
jgi:hypothetical protein